MADMRIVENAPHISGPHSFGRPVAQCSLALLKLAILLIYGFATVHSEAQLINPMTGMAGEVVNPGSEIVQIVPFRGRLLLCAQDGKHGFELMAADPESGQVRLLADIEPGPMGSNPGLIVVSGGQAFFTAATSTYGLELWVTQGTTETTRLVRDIDPGPSGGDIYAVTAIGNGVVFRANDSVHGPELWYSDGTFEGTILVHDLMRGPAGSDLVRLRALGDTVYFMAKTDLAGKALWQTQGTRSSTHPAHKEGPRDVETFLFAAGEWILTGAPLENRGRELWGLARNGRRRPWAKDLNPGPSGSITAEGLEWKGLVYFQAVTDAEGAELWVSDGTSEGTTLVKDIVPGPEGSDPYTFTGSGDSIYFTARTPEHGRELWVTDGSPEGTRLVMDLNPGVIEAIPYDLVPFRGGVLFTAHHPAFDEELWRSTEDGQTYLVRDIFPGPDASVPHRKVFYEDKVYFSALDGVHGTELWVTDGSPEGTRLLSDIALPPEPAPESAPWGLTACGARCVFFARDRGNYCSLYGSDSTADGTVPLLPRLTVDPESLSRLVRVGEVCFGAGLGPENQVVLLKTDGTPAGSGTMEIPHMKGKPVEAVQLMAWRNQLLLRCDSTKAGTTLLTFDPSDAQSRVIAHFSGPGIVSEVGAMTTWNGLLFFTADDGIHGAELWRYVEDTGATELVDDLAAGSIPSSPSALTPCNGKLYFLAGSDQEVALYSLDSPLGRPAMLQPEGKTLSAISGLCAGSPGLFFAARDEEHGCELWRIGETGIPEPVRDIYPGPAGSYPAGIVAAGDRVYFAAEDLHLGVELWSSDGTTAGTYMVNDYYSGSGSAAPVHLTPMGDRMAMSMRGRTRNDITTAHEPFLISLVHGGTGSHAEVCPGPAGSFPMEFCAVGDRIFFTADDGLNGRELWVLDPGRERPRLVKDILAP